MVTSSLLKLDLGQLLEKVERLAGTKLPRELWRLPWNPASTCCACGSKSRLVES